MTTRGIPIPPFLDKLDTRQVRAYLERLRTDLTSDHGDLTGLTDDDHTQYCYIVTGAGAPASTPTRAGNIYVDTANDVVYISVDSNSSGDWLELNAGSGTASEDLIKMHVWMGI